MSASAANLNNFVYTDYDPETKNENFEREEESKAIDVVIKLVCKNTLNKNEIKKGLDILNGSRYLLLTLLKESREENNDSVEQLCDELRSLNIEELRESNVNTDEKQPVEEKVKQLFDSFSSLKKKVDSLLIDMLVINPSKIDTKNGGNLIVVDNTTSFFKDFNKIEVDLFHNTQIRKESTESVKKLITKLTEGLSASDHAAMENVQLLRKKWNELCLISDGLDLNVVLVKRMNKIVFDLKSFSQEVRFLHSEVRKMKQDKVDYKLTQAELGNLDIIVLEIVVEYLKMQQRMKVLRKDLTAILNEYKEDVVHPDLLSKYISESNDADGNRENLNRVVGLVNNQMKELRQKFMAREWEFICITFKDLALQISQLNSEGFFNWKSLASYNVTVSERSFDLTPEVAFDAKMFA